MIRRQARSLILIGIILGISVASLAFRTFDVLGFERGSDDTVLGLRLGLDLQGGSLLVYQSRKDITVDFDPPLTSPVEVSQITDALVELGMPDAGVQREGANTFSISVPSLDLNQEEALRRALEGLGEVKSFQAPVLTEEDVGEVGILVTFADEADRILDVLAPLDLPGVRAIANEDGTITVRVSAMKSRQEQEIREALEGLGTMTSYSVFEPTEDQMRGVLNKIERRIDAFGLTEPEIQRMGNDRILLQLPGVKDIDEAKRLIGDTAQLEMKERICTNDPDRGQSCDDPQYHTDRDIGLTGEDLTRAYGGPDPNPASSRPVVNIEFSGRGAGIFADHTARIAGTNNRTAFILDNQVLIAPVAQRAITGGRAFIAGPDFTLDRVRTIVIQLESGRLDVPIEVIQEQDVDASLGSDSLKKSLIAGLVGLGLVLLFMVLYYRTPGLVAALALTFYAVIVLAVFKLWPITLTLSGLGAFILSTGMAVDANILIFERMKEELRAGRTLTSSINEGFSRAWTAIRDSNVSTLITCAILFWFGNQLGAPLVQGFAITLAIGVLVSMFTAIFVTQTLLRIVAATPLGGSLRSYVPVEHGTAERRRPLLGERSG